MAADSPPPAFLRPRYWPVWLGVALMRALVYVPQRLRTLIGAGLGDLAYWASPGRRRVAETNVGLCLPELEVHARRVLVRRHFRALGAALLGASLVWWGSAARLRRLVRFRDREHYDRALTAGRPVILLAPHFLGLEVGGVYLAHERPFMSMYKRSKNPLFDWLMRRCRLRFGGTLIERDANLKQLIRLLRAGRPFYYLPDQDPGDAEHVFVPFFGVPAATLTALGRIARLGDAVVIPCLTRLLAGGQGYEISFKPALADFPTGDPAGDAARMNAVIEQAVREMPEQYMWTYKRFKQRPAGAAPLYG